MQHTYAIIGGTGFSDHAQEDVNPASAPDSRFGRASAPVRTLNFGSVSVLFLARHGETHSIPPHRVNYRANLAALSALGVDSVIALNAVGVISNIAQSGELALPDQIIDYTSGREHTVYDGSSSELQHIDFSEPFTASLRQDLLLAAQARGIDCINGGVCAVTDGPRLETVAEVNRMARDGADYVGMTSMPEAGLARELGLNYASLALVVNPAAGKGSGSIHASIDEYMQACKTQAISLLSGFFERQS